MSNFLNFAGNSGVTFKTFTAGTSGGDYPTATTYVLDKSASTNSVLVSVGGVLQKPGTDYTVSGTTLTTTSTVTSGIVIDTYIIHDAGNAPVIEDNSIVTAKIADNQVTTAKIADNQVTTAKIANDQVTGAKLNPALVQGDIIYADGTDTINRLAKGTAAQVLTMNAGATAPEWATAGGGALQYVSTQTASGASSISFTSMDEYDRYYLSWDGWVPSTGSYPRLIIITGSSTEVTSGYWAASHYTAVATASHGVWPNSRSTTHITISSQTQTWSSGHFYMWMKADGTDHAIISGECLSLNNATGYETRNLWFGGVDSGAIATGFKLYQDTGTFNGVFRLYGIASS